MSLDQFVSQTIKAAVADALAQVIHDKDQITVNTARAAELLGVSTKQIYALVKHGHLRPVTWPADPEAKGGRPCMYFRVEDLRRAAAENLQGVKA